MKTQDGGMGWLGVSGNSFDWELGVTSTLSCGSGKRLRRRLPESAPNPHR